MGAKLFLGENPDDFSLERTLGKLKVDPGELADAIERNRSNMPIWNRGVTFQMLKNYLIRASNCVDCTPTKFDYSMTSYTMLETVKQDTKKWNCSLAELVNAIVEVAKTRKLKLYPPMVFKPTHFLSYCWAFPLNDIYGEAMSITKVNGDRWGLWIDILTINQPQGQKTAEDLQALDRVIQAIGNVIFVIDAKGTAMTRVWCLFEIMTAVRTKATVTAVFMGHKRSAYESAMLALAVLCGRFDNIDVRTAEATVASDKEMILNQVAQDPGLDEMNVLLRNTLRECALAEFAKEGHNFGSSWWSAEQTFPPFVMVGLQQLVIDTGGWEAMLVSQAEEERALEAAITSGMGKGKNLQYWKPKYRGDLDPDTSLYKKLETCLNLLTWGQRQTPFVEWSEVLDGVAKAEKWQRENPPTAENDDTSDSSSSTRSEYWTDTDSSSPCSSNSESPRLDHSRRGKRGGRATGAGDRRRGLPSRKK